MARHTPVGVDEEEAEEASLARGDGHAAGCIAVAASLPPKVGASLQMAYRMGQMGPAGPKALHVVVT